MMMPILHSKFLLKAGIAAFLPIAAISAPLAQRPPAATPAGAAHANAATVTIAPKDFAYRVAGDFSRGNGPANGPLVTHRLLKPLVVMKTQVSAADYAGCVRARACRALADREPARADLPVVGVSWEDATAYAKWLSAKTGETWRLPTDTEWAFAAGSRFQDDAIASEGGDFTRRWIAKYEQESERERTADRTPQPFGSFGINENGLLDVSGNVWEWTDTCFIRQGIDDANTVIGEPTVNCGVRVVEGRHRTYVSNFIRDARAGGCAVGTPPSNLGFRLVRDDKPAGPVAMLLRRIGIAA